MTIGVRFVCIHGGCCGGSDWAAVAHHLEMRGHTVLAPDLPGMGQDHTPLHELTLERWARFVADLIRAQATPVVLVGHSRGGIVISQAAEYVSDRIISLVYVAAMLVPNGSTQGETSARLPRTVDCFSVSADGIALVADPVKTRGVIYNCTPAEEASRALSQLCPEPAASFGWPLHLTEGRFGSVPRAYVETALDNAIPLSLQRMMQKVLPCAPVFTMHTDHSPAHSAPLELASHLLTIASRSAEVPRSPVDA